MELVRQDKKRISPFFRKIEIWLIFSVLASKSFDDSNSTTSADSKTMPPTEGWDMLVISGIILGTIVFIGVVGMYF